MAASIFLQNDVLTRYFVSQSVYISLYTSDPTSADTGNEVQSVSTGYIRQQATFSLPEQVAGKGQISNTAVISFPIAAADWGNITHFGIKTAQTAGNLLAFGSVVPSKQILSGDRLEFPAGDLKATIV